MKTKSQENQDRSKKTPVYFIVSVNIDDPSMRPIYDRYIEKAKDDGKSFRFFEQFLGKLFGKCGIDEFLQSRVFGKGFEGRCGDGMVAGDVLEISANGTVISRKATGHGEEHKTGP